MGIYTVKKNKKKYLKNPQVRDSTECHKNRRLWR